MSPVTAMVGHHSAGKFKGQQLDILVGKSDQQLIMNHQQHNYSWKRSVCVCVVCGGSWRVSLQCGVWSTVVHAVVCVCEIVLRWRNERTVTLSLCVVCALSLALVLVPEFSMYFVVN